MSLTEMQSSTTPIHFPLSLKQYIWIVGALIIANTVVYRLGMDGLQAGPVRISVLSAFFTTTIILFVFSLPFGFLIALFPYKKLRYKHKLTPAIFTVFLALQILMLIVFSRSFFL